MFLRHQTTPCFLSRNEQEKELPRSAAPRAARRIFLLKY
jgi:hypothetical protein